MYYYNQEGLYQGITGLTPFNFFGTLFSNYLTFTIPNAETQKLL